MAEGDQVHPIMKLPEEIRGVIFNKLRQHDALNLRLVSKQWQQDIDNFFDFNIELDDRSPYFEKIRGLRIKKCFIKTLKRGVWPATDSLLKHPEILQTLESRTKDIAANKLKVILESSAEYIRGIIVERKTMCLDLLRFTRWLPSNDFKNLKALNIVFPGEWVYGRSGNGNEWTKKIYSTKERNLIHSFAIPIMPKLESIKFQVPDLTASTMNERGLNKSLNVLMMRLIAMHWKSLKYVNIALPAVKEKSLEFDQFEVAHRSNLSAPDYQFYKKIDSLSKLKIRASVDRYFPTDFWTELLVSQRKLTEVKVHLCHFNVPLSLCRQVVYNNMDTLVYIGIHDLNIEPNDKNVDVEADKGRPFDLTLFENFSSLRILKLGRCELNGPQYHRTRSPLVNEIINLSNVPKGLVQFEINYFLTDTVELLTFCSNLSPDLRKLGLSFCGYLGSFGVNGSVIEAIMQNVNLVEVEIHAFNFVFHGNTVFDKFVSVVENIEGWDHDTENIDDMECFNLKRDSVDGIWKIENVVIGFGVYG